ncbi:MAG: molybdopterin-guanine dinucleotide biosynthesis protein MobB [Clostridia bacterium]|nr:molybdopterin-guanine dinucleotide biosynthesis protein MobB [Clostridia bacterium]MBQ4609179.1 molybdopterin-guanine dinucleotide biosynthesis protein MobB [Clostridia bacterium]MBQ6859279.1 molybdopterin-guanine dinucleotide biosynthesis protein MobB [Clostridia bacterium]MBQ7052599.1 molybdopterin-guanine dinucleotide biosynthesis protein MobB [Clostridia bacterium]
MKIITVVGIRKSGKTSTVVALIEAIRRRGKKVGTCKTVFCPTFSMDKATSNTAKHRRAGSELVCARARFETAFLYPEALPLSKVLENYKDCDYVLLEGDYFASVPRIVCAHLEEDALMRMNSRTLAFCGRISQKPEIELPLPRFNALENADALLDYIDSKVPDIMPCSLLDEPLPPVPGVTDDGFCQCGCHHHEKKQEKEALQILFEGSEITLTAAQRETLLGWIKEARDAE